MLAEISNQYHQYRLQILLILYRLQYQIKNTDMSTMMSIGGPLMLVTQLLIIPFLR